MFCPSHASRLDWLWAMAGALLEIRMDHLAHRRILEQGKDAETASATYENWIFGDIDSRPRSFPPI
jgi:hypothetical protein